MINRAFQFLLTGTHNTFLPPFCHSAVQWKWFHTTFTKYAQLRTRIFSLPLCTAPFSPAGTHSQVASCAYIKSQALHSLPPLSFLLVKHVRIFAHVSSHLFSKTPPLSLLPFSVSSFCAPFASRPASWLRPSVNSDACAVRNAAHDGRQTFWDLS